MFSYLDYLNYVYANNSKFVIVSNIISIMFEKTAEIIS